MKLVRKCILGFMITACVVCFFAPKGYALHELFKNLDLNKDGAVDRNEFSEDMKREAFNKLDADQNREISYEEWKRLYSMEEPDTYGEIFSRMDKDKNKGITFFEFSDYADRHSNIDEAFMGLDKNGNNSIEQDELTVRPLFKWITVRF